MCGGRRRRISQKQIRLAISILDQLVRAVEVGGGLARSRLDELLVLASTCGGSRRRISQWQIRLASSRLDQLVCAVEVGGGGRRGGVYNTRTEELEQYSSTVLVVQRYGYQYYISAHRILRARFKSFSSIAVQIWQYTTTILVLQQYGYYNTTSTHLALSARLTSHSSIVVHKYSSTCRVVHGYYYNTSAHPILSARLKVCRALVVQQYSFSSILLVVVVRLLQEHTRTPDFERLTYHYCQQYTTKTLLLYCYTPIYY